MPAAFVVADLSIPVARLRTRTDARGTTAPLASATCPRRAPVATEFWAKTEMQLASASKTIPAILHCIWAVVRAKSNVRHNRYEFIGLMEASLGAKVGNAQFGNAQ